ncbi:FAST kinase domain-containing protein 2, mitochondrial [Myripristis murdjan]|uniref:FAST kinase domains 2 n=1 Tax=Myripristis murdjan TaxID=586833 RepID=A0A668A1Z7_9TELE|nr:FAST kinase domain-containing protein 2, mitochondrial [Myripristis murdjan]XP_029924371.1 FAST kinase domain-containing protein 2, mitochondrial [Myripristis murdjan]XP_029924379.1 FAST kinase domain-containing protein 2, mitochondrial [Myripristis murdjan]
MTAWVTEEVMRFALRFCSRRSLWQQRHRPIISVRDASSSDKWLPHIWSTRQSQTPLAGNVLSSVRYYSQGFSPNERLEEKSTRPSPSSSPSESQPTDSVLVKTRKANPFFAKLEECRSPMDVLDLTCQCEVTNRHISNCLSHMWTTTKKLSEEQRRYELQLVFEHPGFEKLLQKAMKAARHMQHEDLAYCLLAVIKLGVPQRSRVVQTFLRACQENLNEFDEKCLSILASCLEHMESSPNVDALKEGMRLVVENHLPRIKDVMPLQTMMRIVGKDAPLALKKKLEKKALSMTDQFSLPNSQYMITTMAAMGFHSRLLLDVCSEKITENINGIPFNRIFKVLKACRELHYRDLGLLTGISDYIATTLDIWRTKQVVLLLSAFKDLAFCPAALMEAFAERLIANPDALTLKDTLCVIKAYSSLNYDLREHRQQFLDSVSRVLDSYLSRMSPPEVLKVVYCLCVLVHFPPALLEHLLQSSTLEQLSTTTGHKFILGQERKFQTVDLCLRLDRPPLPRPLTVPPSVLGSPALGSPSSSPELSRALQGAVGDGADWLLQESVMVENAYFIDGVVSKPPVLTERESREESGVESPPAESSQRIAVICTPSSALCYGTSRPRGPLAVKIRHLRVLGYTPVLVTAQELESASEEDRAEMLRSRIFPEDRGSDSELKAQ